MVYSITHKGINLSEAVYQKVDQNFNKLARFLPHIPKDLSLVRLNIKKMGNFFEGSLNLNLPRQILNIHFRKDSLGGAINLGFERLFERLTKYKGKHFVNNSEYPKKVNSGWVI